MYLEDECEVEHLDDAMKYDQILQYAKERGDCANPNFLKLQQEIPGWLTVLGSQSGMENLEKKFGIAISEPLRKYLSDRRLAVILEAGSDYETFLCELQNCTQKDPPYFARWDEKPHLIIAFHNHSGVVHGVDLTESGKLVRQGILEEADVDFWQKPIEFEDWLWDLVQSANVDSYSGRSRTIDVEIKEGGLNVPIQNVIKRAWGWFRRKRKGN